MKTKKTGLKGFIKLVIAIVAVFVIGTVSSSYALIDETNSVHIEASEIEDATLIIGTHLIYLGSMNEQIYEIAMKSAEEANQYQRYYKSEIAGGVWYDITEAGALADITTDGIVVEDKVIEALFMTHHTKSDGITYDLRNKEAVGVFDIEDPYDLEGMKELDPIKIQYEVLVQTENPTDTMERDILNIKEIYTYDRQTDKTREIDAQMDALQEYYNILVRDGAEESMSDMVMSVMEKLDAARRVEILEPLKDTQLQKMSQVTGREFCYLEGEITGIYSETSETEEEGENTESGRAVVENFVPNSDLLAAIGEALSKVQESYTHYSSRMMSEGTTVLSRAEYRFSRELIEKAQSENYSGCDEAVEKLIYLDRINNSNIREETQEREFIMQELLPEAKADYRSSLGAGVGEAYQTLSSQAAAATKASVLKNQLSGTEVVRNELQFIIQAYIDRMTPENGIIYITECIDSIGDYRSAVKADPYETYAITSVDSHLEWLTKVLKNLQDLLGTSTLDDLRMQKDDLQTELMTALDHNKLDEAKKIEAEMEAIDLEMSETEAYLNSVLNSDNASESEKALAASQLGSGNALVSLQEMKEEAIENIKNGNIEAVSGLLDGMGALGTVKPDGVMGALEDIYEELSNQELMGEDGLDDLKHQIEEIAAEQIGNLPDELSEDAITALAQSFISENQDGTLESSLNDNQEENLKSDEWMKNLSDSQMAVVLAGLSMYAESGNENDVLDLLKTYSRFAFNNGNLYVYEQLKNELFEFLPTDKLSKITGYRYIFNDSRKAVTMQKGSQYYKFEAFSSSVQKKKETEEMTRAAGFQKVIYIPKDFTQEYFSVTAEYLYKTSYGVILTEEMNSQALEFLDYLLEAGGEL